VPWAMGKKVRTKAFTIGSDFSGVHTLGVALRKTVRKLPGVCHKHVSACDKNRACRTIITNTDKPQRFFKNVTTRTLHDVPYCDIFGLTAPCTSFSQAGNREGLSRFEGKLYYYSLLYVAKRHPKLVISEIVPTLAHKFKDFMLAFVDFFRRQDYVVEWKILNTYDYAVPHWRKR